MREIKPLSLLQKKLAAAALKARQNAYAPYSKYRVGAALLTASGKIISGSNVENASYGLTLCAERAAVVQAVSGGDKKFAAIAVAGSGKELVAPCGACRQVLAEFNPNLTVYLVSRGGRVTETSLSSLLPSAFSKKHL